MEPGEFLANSATATLRKTALNAVHRALGAKMVDFGGCRTADHALCADQDR